MSVIFYLRQRCSEITEDAIRKGAPPAGGRSEISVAFRDRFQRYVPGAILWNVNLPRSSASTLAALLPDWRGCNVTWAWRAEAARRNRLEPGFNLGVLSLGGGVFAPMRRTQAARIAGKRLTLEF